MSDTKNPFLESFSNDPFHEHLAQFIKKKFTSWKRKYPNVNGVDIARKITNGKYSDQLAISFHVETKTDLISPTEFIPPFINVTFKKKRYEVPTDIILTGSSELNYLAPGQNIFQYNNFNRRGTFGLIVTKNNLLYLLSNMHVLGWSYLAHTTSLVIDPINTNIPPDINCLVQNLLCPAGYFSRGKVDQFVDAALAFIPTNLHGFINPRSDIIDVGNPIILPQTTLVRPIPMRMLGAISGFRDSLIVSSVAVQSFPYPFGQQTLINLLAIRPCCSQPGDSGSAVYDPLTGRIFGIILGRDVNATTSYAVSFNAIQNALELD